MVSVRLAQARRACVRGFSKESNKSWVPIEDRTLQKVTRQALVRWTEPGSPWCLKFNVDCLHVRSTSLPSSR
jgi:hypothetical protein